MILPEDAVLASRVLIPILGLIVWALFYLNARFAYRFPRGGKRTASMLSVVSGYIGIFVLQVNIISHLAPVDAHGLYFHVFILTEAGGGLVVLFSTLFWERSRSRKLGSDSSNVASQERLEVGLRSEPR